MLLRLSIILWFLSMAALLGYLFTDGGKLRTSDQRGYLLYSENNYKESAKTYTDSYWKAIALFKSGEFKDAENLFAGYPTAEANYNRGNAQVMQGKYSEAALSYERALQLKPDWDDARANLELALARAKLLEKTGGEMTGGMLEADEIVFNDKPSQSGSNEQDEIVEGTQLSDAEMRALWLRDVRTNPADFLRAKFSYQASQQ
ncbi:tetratricopeptide repeat protein [Coraliomargarita akajimensis]|uniref:tetratricopeptide repeat protein n=1 Tax=Coraliomargarita akajimensis TaxID=395922 RepID=UPI0005A0AC25|nr:tetratricopeptide repeat protein [Coraliomargarita akajimensis]